MRIIKQPRTVVALILTLCIVFSLTVASPYFSNPSHHQHTLDTIGESKANATALSLTITLASTAISLLPDDTGSAIANELSELSTPLLIIVCVLFFEQYLLTAMETLSFTILFPIAGMLFIAYLYLNRKTLQILSVKFFLIAILCAIVIPFSAVLTSMIRATFAESAAAMQAQLDTIQDAFSQMLGEGNDNDVFGFISNLASGISDILSFAKDALGILIDAVAILLITSCVIPIITLLLFLWCVKNIIAGRMENLEDTVMSILKKFPSKKKNLPSPEDPDENMKLIA